MTTTERRVLVELCVDDVDGARAAERSGADRVELCANLLEGGTTPSLGMVAGVLAAVEHVGVQVIIRPRGGSFVHDDDEVDVMLADVEMVRRLPTRVPVGFVIGSLTREGRVDAVTTARLVQAAAGAPVTFHRAVDEARDLDEAVEDLVALGVGRVLTGGGPGPAAQGAQTLAVLQARTAGRIGVLAAGAIRPDNVTELLARTGVREVHARAPVERDGRTATSQALAQALVQACRGPLPDLS